MLGLGGRGIGAQDTWRQERSGGRYAVPSDATTRHSRIARQGAHHRRLPGPGLRRGVQRGAHPRPSEAGVRRQEGRSAALWHPRGRRRARVRAAVCPRRGQEARRLRPEEEARRVGRAPARDGRGPRGRGDRLPPRRGAEAEGAGEADGLPRDHPRGDPARARGDAGHRRAARRRAGDAADPRSATRCIRLASPSTAIWLGSTSSSRRWIGV